MTNKLHLEVQIFITKQRYNAGMFLILSALLLLFFLFKDFSPTNQEFLDSLSFHSVISGILVLLGSFI